MRYGISILGRTDTRNRTENQDSFFLDSLIRPVNEDCTCLWENLEVAYDKTYLVALADGISGASHGKQAALAALHAVWDAFSEKGGSSDSLDMRDLICQLIDVAQEAVLDIGKATRTGVGTTICMLMWRGMDFCLANVGDSPGFLLRGGKLQRLSEEHTKAVWAKRAGLRPKREEFQQLVYYLGNPDMAGRDMVHIYEGSFLEGDMILLCSDGMTNDLNERKLGRLMSQCQNQLRQAPDLFWKALHKQHGDNTTMVLLQMNHLHTYTFQESLNQITDEAEMEAFWKSYGGYQQDWNQYVGQVLKRAGLDKRTVTRLMNPELLNVPNWLKKGWIPSNRDLLLCLGVACGMDQDQMNEMLLKAQTYQLYPKNLRDAVVIYLLEHGAWRSQMVEKLARDAGPDRQDPLKGFASLYSKGINGLLEGLWAYAENRRTHFIRKQKSLVDTPTNQLMEVLVQDKAFDEMLDVLLKKMSPGYRQFYQCIAQEINLGDHDNIGLTVHRLPYSNGCQQRYYRTLQRIKDHHMPGRLFVIVFGTQVDMSVEEVNRLLAMAGMQRLYPKDPLEYLLIFYMNRYQRLLETEIDNAIGRSGDHRRPEDAGRKNIARTQIMLGSMEGYYNEALYLAEKLHDYKDRLGELDNYKELMRWYDQS